jgi:hypothetical protein
MRNSLILGIALLGSTLAFSQTQEIEKNVSETGEMQKARLNEMFGAKRDSVFAHFDASFKELFYRTARVDDSVLAGNNYFEVDMATENFSAIHFAYSFINNLVVANSKDQRIRIISSDNLGGGSWHNYDSHIQLFDAQQVINTRQLEIDNDELDVGYYKIEQLEHNDSTYYIAFGYGTEGSGNHHRVVKVYRIENDSIVVQPSFEGKSLLGIVSRRAEDVELKYDPTTRAISYLEFETTYDEKTDEYTSNELVVRWKFEDGKFVQEGTPKK